MQGGGPAYLVGLRYSQQPVDQELVMGGQGQCDRVVEAVMLPGIEGGKLRLGTAACQRVQGGVDPHRDGRGRGGIAPGSDQRGAERLVELPVHRRQQVGDEGRADRPHDQRLPVQFARRGGRIIRTRIHGGETLRLHRSPMTPQGYGGNTHRDDGKSVPVRITRSGEIRN